MVARDALWDRAHTLAAKVAAKPSAATQGTLKAIWESLNVGRQAALDMGLKYCLLGNPVGTREVSRDAIMASAKSYEVR